MFLLCCTGNTLLHVFGEHFVKYVCSALLTNCKYHLQCRYDLNNLNSCCFLYRYMMNTCACCCC